MFSRTQRQESWRITIPTAKDLLVVNQVAQLLSSREKWNRSDTETHECTATAKAFTLYCALELSDTKVYGSFKHRDAVMQEARFLIEQNEHGKRYTHRLLDYNNDPGVNFSDLTKFLELLKTRIEQQIKDLDIADHAL